MGGLLAAEAATDPSNALDERTGKPRRIVGVVAFDTPYLGMHPHVIISGIASLFPKNTKEEQEKLENEMNAHPDVTVVPGKVTDDWESVKRDAAVRPSYDRTSSGTSSYLSAVHSFSSSASSSKRSLASFRSASPLFDRVLDFTSEQADRPFARWLKKHSDDPVSAGKRWVVERLQFGGATFDPTGLKERYVRLVGWQNGMWVNYWTQTPPKSTESGRPEHEDDKRKEEELAYNDLGLMESGIVATPAKSESFSSSIEREWMREIGKLEKHETKPDGKERKIKGGRHFIILPTGLGRKFGGEGNWQKVVIGGVDDEVAAHCGLFIRGQNLDYDGLVDRVGQRILDWCGRLQT